MDRGLGQHIHGAGRVGRPRQIRRIYTATLRYAARTFETSSPRVRGLREPAQRSEPTRTARLRAEGGAAREREGKSRGKFSSPRASAAKRATRTARLRAEGASARERVGDS